MKEVIIFEVKIEGLYRVEADDSATAINKTKTWVAGNPGKLNYSTIGIAATVKGKDD